MQLLNKVLIILASEKVQQINYLFELGTSPSTDEFALEFNDAYKVFLGNIDERENNNFVNEKFLNKLNEIDIIFNEMSNLSNNDFWNISSLNSNEWDKIRELAKECLLLSS